MKRSLFVTVALVFAMGLVAQGFEVGQVEKAGSPSKTMRTNNMLKNWKPVAQMPFLQVVNVEKSTNTLRAGGEGTWLNGTMQCNVRDAYFGEELSFEVRVEADKNETNKYWFWNLLNIPSAKDSIYAILDGDKLTFPANQSFGKIDLTSGQSDDLNLALWSLSGGQIQTDVTSPIVATIDEQQGTIVFPDIIGYLPALESILQNAIFQDVVLYAPGYEPLDLSYKFPQGTLFHGFSDNGLIMSYLSGVGAENTTWEWSAVCPNAVQGSTYTWMYMGSEDANPTTVEGTKLTMDVKAGEIYTFPILTLKDEKREQSYVEGMNLYYDPSSQQVLSLIQAGGASMEVDGQDGNGTVIKGTVQLTNASIDRLYTIEMIGQNAYSYGSGAIPVQGGSVYLGGVAARYEKPFGALSFAGVDVLCEYDAASISDLKLTVVKISEELDEENGGIIITDTVAWSYTVKGTQWDVTNGLSTGVLTFSNFVKEDEAGFETEVVRMDLSDTPFALILTGFGQGKNVTVGVATEATAGNENFAYIMLPDKNGNLQSTSWVDANTHLFMLLRDAVYGSGASSVENVSANTTKLYTTSDAFNFTYTDDFTSMDVYNMNGQKVSSYALPQTGTFSIAKSALSDGVYMFRMNGKSTEVLRAVK